MNLSGFNNPRISAKERNLIKGAIRRVFSRSELRRAAIAAATIEHHDPKRPRVTKWVRCAGCKEPVAAYQVDVDHILPVVPVDLKLEEMSIDGLVWRIWCEPNCLQILCKPCHHSKSRAEMKERRRAQKERKEKHT